MIIIKSVKPIQRSLSFQNKLLYINDSHKLQYCSLFKKLAIKVTHYCAYYFKKLLLFVFSNRSFNDKNLVMNIFYSILLTSYLYII